MARWRSIDWRLGLLLLLVLLGTAVQQNVLPLMEGADEPLHYTYAEYLRQVNHLPDRATFMTNPTRQESGQPPLAYWLASLLPRALGLDTFPAEEVHPYLETVKNRWFTPPDLWNRFDNLNVYLHGEGTHTLNNPTVLAVLRVLRWSSLGWALLAVVGAYLAAWELFESRRWALVAAAVFAFIPTFLHISSSFTNDIGATALGTLILWRAVRFVRTGGSHRVGASIRDALWLGLLLGVGILIKVSVALLAPAVGLALLLEAIQHPNALRRLVTHSLLLGGCLLVMVGPWIAFGWLTFNDPFGFQTHVNDLSTHTTPLGLLGFAALLPEVYLSYLGKYGASVYLRPETYTALAGLLLLAGSGYAIAGWAHRRDLRLSWLWRSPHGRQSLVLGTAALAMLLGLARWLQTIRFITGRLLYPAHICTALLIAGGLYLLARRAPRAGWVARVLIVGLLAGISLIGTPLAVRGAYRAPTLLAQDELPDLAGAPLDFDGTIRLLGYQLPETRIAPGELHAITLCWEVLQPTERHAGFAIKIVHDGEIVGSRTSLLGMGHYPSFWWQPGDRWCDRVVIPIEKTIAPAQVYDVLVHLLDAETQAFDWQAATPDGTPVELPFITQVISPAGDMTGAFSAEVPAAIRFPGFASLEAYALRGDPVAGEEVTLDLVWRVEGQTADDWQQFVHLLGPGETVSLAGGAPRGGNYPAWAWAVGERVADSWVLHLPEDLPPGEYALGLGFFLPDSGARMPALVEEAPATDNVAILTRFTLD